MILQISLFTKAPMTNVAFKRPSTGVDISMGFEITRRWERFATHSTFMWLFLENKNENKNKLNFGIYDSTSTYIFTLCI